MLGRFSVFTNLFMGLPIGVIKKKFEMHHIKLFDPAKLGNAVLNIGVNNRTLNLGSGRKPHGAMSVFIRVIFSRSLR